MLFEFSIEERILILSIAFYSGGKVALKSQSDREHRVSATQRRVWNLMFV
jgi:hypothetical protein